MFSRKHRSVLHYSLLFHDTYNGHAMLIWCYSPRENAVPNPREEFIEITPSGFNLWTEHFTSLKDLIKWFKKTGWRLSTKYRMDFKTAWDMRRQRRAEERGLNLLEGKKSSNFAKLREQQQAVGGAGLMTPGGLTTPGGTPAPATASGHAPETPAPETPRGA